MAYAVNCELLRYAVTSILISSDKDIDEIENNLNQNFSFLCDWLLDSKLRIRLWAAEFEAINGNLPEQGFYLGFYYPYFLIH